MDMDESSGVPPSGDDRVSQQVDNAIRAIQQKKPRPEIDFTIHVLEDGTQVSTMERVCKGRTNPKPLTDSGRSLTWLRHFRCAGAGHAEADRRAVLRGRVSSET